MLKIIGFVLVFVATIGGFFLGGGSMGIITHAILPAFPGEALTILGCAIAAFLIHGFRLWRLDRRLNRAERP